VTVTPTGLLYVKGGGAWMKDNFTLSLTPAGAAFLGGLGVAAAPGTVASVGFNSSGWTAGAGFEWAFNDRVSVFAEYDYLSFGTTTANFATAVPPLPAAFSLGVSHNVNVFTVGVNLRFGPGTF